LCSNIDGDLIVNSSTGRGCVCIPLNHVQARESTQSLKERIIKRLDGSSADRVRRLILQGKHANGERTGHLWGSQGMFLWKVLRVRRWVQGLMDFREPFRHVGYWRRQEAASRRRRCI